MLGRNKEKASNDGFDASKEQIKRATRPRMIWALVTSLLLVISVVFLILVEIGNTSINPTLNKIYFINLDLSNIIPVSVPNAALINSIARTLGLHDFYTVGLWNFCEGYNGPGVTHCSDPQTLYWFNPVAILKRELIAGASSIPFSMKTIYALLIRASCPTARSQQHPQPHTHRLKMDVWSLPHWRDRELHYDFHSTVLGHEPLGNATNHDSNVLRSAFHHRRYGHSHSNVCMYLRC